MNQHEKINYVELPAKNFAATKAFFSAVFDFKFVDYGEQYMAFSNSGLAGGFYLTNLSSQTKQGAPLIIFYSNALEETLEKVKNAGGNICKDIFDFPGGRRFQFTDPNDNEFAVWSDQG